MHNFKHLTIIGGGSWATALVRIFSDSGVQVKWYLRSSQAVTFIKDHGRNPNYLSFLQLRKDHISPTADIEEAIRFSDNLLFAVPSAYLESAVSSIGPEDILEKNLIVSIKGIVPHHELIPSAFLAKKFSVPAERFIVLGGPCHAEEVALERKTYVTIASRDVERAQALMESIQLDFIKVIVNNDPLGVEMAAILKNVVGIACGIATGLNYGDNFQAVLVANALHEVNDFLYAMDHRKRDLTRSGYYGDLLVTAYSPFSRNRTFGQMIGRGYTVYLAQSEMNMIAEGYYAVDGAYRMLREMHLDCPIISAIYRILYNKISPYLEFKLLENKLI